MTTHRFISWGLGRQSTWLGVMSALGELPRVDAMVVADTQWERHKTYDILKFYTQWFSEHDIRVEVVTAGNIRVLGAEAHIHIPFFTESGGPLQRQCTNHFKIIPLRRAMRRIAGYHETRPPHPKRGSFEVWTGISWDEFDRMSTSRTKYIVNRYPLIEKHLNWWDCVAGYKRLGLPVPPKSACIGCPYRDPERWLEMKTDSPDEFMDAVAFDEENRNNPLAVRGNSTADKLYVWHGLIPLKDVDFSAEIKRENAKQTSLFVCTGDVCWT